MGDIHNCTVFHLLNDDASCFLTVFSLINDDASCYLSGFRPSRHAHISDIRRNIGILGGRVLDMNDRCLQGGKIPQRVRRRLLFIFLAPTALVAVTLVDVVHHVRFARGSSVVGRRNLQNVCTEKRDVKLLELGPRHWFGCSNTLSYWVYVIVVRDVCEHLVKIKYNVRTKSQVEEVQSAALEGARLALFGANDIN